MTQRPLLARARVAEARSPNCGLVIVRRSSADGLDDAGFVVAAVETSASEAIEPVSLHQPHVFVVA